MATTTMADLETEIQSIASAAITNLKSAPLRQIADFIDGFYKIQGEIDTEKAGLDAMNAPAAPAQASS